MAVDGLPVMDDLPRILADEIRLDLLHGLGAGFGAALEDRFAQPGDAGVGVNLQEQPSRLDEEGFELGDLERILASDGGVLGALRVLRRIARINPDWPVLRRGWYDDSG